MLRNTRTTTRPIIVRFCSFRKRQIVFKEKKKIKDKGITITESLTKSRYDLFKAAVTKYGRGQVWTNEGRITTKQQDRYFTINCLNDLV